MKFTHDLAAAVKQHQALKTKIENGLRQIVSQAQPLDDARFDELSICLRNEMLDSEKNWKTPERGIDEFCRLGLCEQQPNYGDLVSVYTLDDVVRYLRTYNHKRGQCRTALKDAKTGRGDDGFGDLCDSLPLLGKEWLDKIKLIPEQEYTWKIFDREAKEGLDPALYELVFEGENYVSSRLEEKLVEFLPSAVTHGEVVDPQNITFEFATPARDFHGQLVTYTAVVRDLDEQKAAQRLNKMLEGAKISIDWEDKQIDNFDIFIHPVVQKDHVTRFHV